MGGNETKPEWNEMKIISVILDENSIQSGNNYLGPHLKAFCCCISLEIDPADIRSSYF